MSITLNEVNHAFGDVTALFNVSFSVDTAEIVCVLGPSGSGKSTLLKLIAGLETLQQGTIGLPSLEVKPTHQPPAEDRPAGLVFQEHALFPHLDVASNIGFGLAHLAREARDNRVNELLRLTGLEALADRYPHMLSGGQQQRVALARSLAPAPAVMLMDEPFASIDVLLRKQLRRETRELLRDTGMTSLIVTHDPEDALQLADRIAVIVAGELVQYGTPEELWQSPAHPFVAEVFASRQLLRAQVTASGFSCAFGLVESTAVANLDEAADVTLAVDPWQVDIAVDPDGDTVISDIRFSGDHRLITLVATDATRLIVKSRDDALVPEQRVTVQIAPQSVVAYD